jgi:hypothetical protein
MLLGASSWEEERLPTCQNGASVSPVARFKEEGLENGARVDLNIRKET